MHGSGAVKWDAGMSIRRKAGDWVWLRAGAGMTGESTRLKAELQPEGDDDHAPCRYNCGDPGCREWYTLWTERDPKGSKKRHVLCHVSECEMFDERQEVRGAPNPRAQGGRCER
mgnify:CR=1 FL=1